ncbi:Beta-galactosidase BoGH2A [Lachnellula suecica]|uniref:Beta-galactosidase BoGH2A n=1 Tax=Lachnellula suecica TaxID=602035 RepID=A0A8T9CBD0_9HELO|nr:Beta-galactosidase BoGH2A [Lachnellula suecica]
MKRERQSLNQGWRFQRTVENPDGLVYDYRPDLTIGNNTTILKPWILPSGNEFINEPANRHERPSGNPGGNVTFVQNSFNDSSWEIVNLPHDWAIKGPFYTGENAVVGGGMGRLPVQGIGWYRRSLTISALDKDKNIYLDIDGAMSYAMVWLNGNLVGGWPYGYNSFRLDLTPYVNSGTDNVLAIRLDNPTDFSRWYPGGGIYRNVWLTKVVPVHVAQYGTFISTRDVSAQGATLDLTVQVENTRTTTEEVEVLTEVHILDSATETIGAKAAEFPSSKLTLQSGEKQPLNTSVKIQNPQLWGPLRTQQAPNLYVAITKVFSDGKEIDSYETRFGVRSLTYNSDNGLLVNGEKVRIQGVNQHHDLGAIGSAFNFRAAERQLEILRDMGTNAIRMSHNPPAPELLDLTDQMGFLVLDEIFDCWELNKTSSDFHLIFDDWHEPDLRSFIRRDRNHPSVIAWSFGNEVGEQYTDVAGAALAQKLHDIVHEEDPTRPATASMNYAKPYMPFPVVMDILALNYQGEGIRDAAAYANLSGIKTPPLYPAFHEMFPGKLLFSSETASTFSSRGTFLFPVTNETSAPVTDTSGGNSLLEQVSSYELYSANFGSSPDKVFAAQDNNSYVAGEFVWSGFDYLGEPTPYDPARSSYSGIVDLAGFPKDRYYLYQSRWRPDLKMAHILPHWTWPDRIGLVTPVHVFSAGDEAELFVNGQSQGRIMKAAFTYRFRWDDVVYQPGEVHVITYKNGTEWASDTVQTAGPAAYIQLVADRKTIQADGSDSSYITATVLDKQGVVVPQAENSIVFSIVGPGDIVATDNGDPASLVPFPSKVRKTYSGLALAIVRAVPGMSGAINITATGEGLIDGYIVLETLI